MIYPNDPWGPFIYSLGPALPAVVVWHALSQRGKLVRYLATLGAVVASFVAITAMRKGF
jgi:hypothetical protein